MPHTILLRIIFLSSLISLIHSQNCKWLQPKQEYLSKRILSAFNQMSSLESPFGMCTHNITELPNIDDVYNITQVGNEVIAVREVFNQTIWFYDKHHTKLHCHEKPWERLQALLHYVDNLLDDCLKEGAENPEFKEKISEYFNILENNVMEVDNKCDRSIVHISIKQNLQLALQLSSRIRRRHLLKNISHVQ